MITLNLIKKTAALLLILTLALSMAACGAGSSGAAGKYVGTTITAQGITLPMHKGYSGETWLELKLFGKGTAMVDGQEFPLQWTLDGNVITLILDGTTNVGTLKSGVITVDLMDSGYVLEFCREDVISQETTPTYQHAGYWSLILAEDDDGAANENDLLPWLANGYLYLELKEDGTGQLFTDQAVPITWQDGTITFVNDEASVPYTVEGDVLFLAFLNISLVFRKGEKPEIVSSEMEAAGFTRFMETGVTSPYTTLCGDEEGLFTTGEAVVTSYEIFDSAEGYLGTDGYEWRVVKMEVRFFDQNAQDYGMVTFSNAEDYYNTKLHDDTYRDIKEEDNSTYRSYRTLYQGQEEEIYEKTTTYWGGWQESEDGRQESVTYYEWAMRVPVGYDGCVVGLRDGRLEWKDGTYITDYDPSNFLLFRLN